MYTHTKQNLFTENSFKTVYTYRTKSLYWKFFQNKLNVVIVTQEFQIFAKKMFLVRVTPLELC